MKKLTLLLTLFCAALIVTSCDKEESCVERKKDDCNVSYELNPVCGCNGITYDNPSIAECRGISDYTMGSCE
jgi:hypothetical protein